MSTKLDNPIIPNVDTLLAAVQRSPFGMAMVRFCLSCGARHETWCEPNMDHGVCEVCGDHQVSSAKQILLGFVS